MNYDKIKICKKCKTNPTTGRSSYCQACRKTYDKDYFKGHVAEKSAAASQTKRQILDWYYGLKDNKLCLGCGGGPFRFYQMDYDHIPTRGKKFKEVSAMVRLGYSKEKIMAEIAKCQLICANCHRARTFNRRHGKDVGTGLF